MPDPTIDKRERSPAVVIAAIVVLLTPLAYLFSTGPVHWLVTHGYVGKGANDFLIWLYTPLRYLHGNSDVCRTMIDLWLAIWD